MIQAYKKGNENFERNAETVLHPKSCELTCELNGSWTLNLKHPKDDEGRWKGIEEEGIISASTFIGEKQLFRICEIERTLDTIEVTAYPIFFDSADDCFIVDKRPEEKNGQEALDILMEESKYSGESDITSVSTAYFVRRNLMDAINGSSSPTFLQRWGGEILYDNYKVIVNHRIGQDRGVEIRYGKNMEEIEQQIDYTNVVTRIVPVAYNGYTLDTDHPWVDSPLVDKYAKIYTKEMKFDDVRLQEDAEGDAEDDVIVCSTLQELREELKKKCEEQYLNGIDKPAISITCSMVDLSQTDEYKDFKNLEKVSLGDTVHCINYDLGIMIDARAIKLTYDCILERVSTVTIGDTEYNFFNEAYSAVDRVDQAIRSDGTVIAEQVYGAINTLNAFLHAQSTVAKRTDSVAYLIEDLDQNSELYGAMEAGTQGLRLAKERKDGEWIWRTAVTAAGIIADLIVTGKIQDRLGKSYWDLDNGKMLLSGIFQQITDNGKKSVDIKNNRINIYSWQKEGDYVGSIGSLAIGDDLSAKQRIGVYCDTEDMLVFGYSSKKTAEGDAATVHELMKLSKAGGIECTEIPQINGTKTGRLVFSNGTYVNVKNGYIVGGKTEEGSF